MVLKSLNLMINNVCNNRCTSCNIWNSQNKQSLNTKDIKKMLERPEFQDITDISITGGEPILNKDINEILENIVKLPNLEMLFFNSNGFETSKLEKLINEFKNKVPQLYFCISFEGSRKIHNQIRGIDCYDKVISSLDMLGPYVDENFNVITSSTIQQLNADENNILSVIESVKSRNLTYSYRFMDIGVYYNNFELKSQILSNEEKLKISDFIEKVNGSDIYLNYQNEVIRTGKNPLMIDEDGISRCLAGNAFAFIDCSGEIRPCIYSSRTIGLITEGIFSIPNDLGAFEPCPCCTECTIYPMMNYGAENENK